MPSLIQIGPWLFALITLTGAVATLVSNEPILSQCSKSCWLNSLLLALFGETGARIGVALLWVSVAALFIFLGGKIKKKVSHESQHFGQARIAYGIRLPQTLGRTTATRRVLNMDIER